MRAKLKLIICFLVSIGHSYGAETVLELNQPTSASLGRYISYNDSLPVSASTESLRSAEFISIDQPVANFGLNHDPVWIKLSLANLQSSETKWVLSLNRSLLDNLRIVFDKTTSAFEILTLDNRIPSYREFGTWAAPFDLGPGEAGTFYLFYQGANSSVLPLSIETRKSIEEARLFRLILFFSSLTGVLTLVVYNSLMAVITRIPAFLYYGAAQISLLIYFSHLSGITTIYLWPESPDIGTVLAPNLAVLTCLLNLQFIKSFVRAKYLNTNLLRVINSILLASTLYLTLSLLSILGGFDTSYLASLAAFVSSLTIIILPVAGFFAARNGRRRFLPMTIAWCWFSASMTYTTLSLLNAVPVMPGFFESYMAFSFIEAMLLAISLALAVRHIEKSRVIAQTSLAKSLKAELIESRKSEQLMRQRTVALNDLADRGRLLQSAGHDTRQALFAMRQFTAGLDSETSNPSRLETIRQSMDQLVNHVDDVLATTLAGAHGGAMIDKVLAFEKVSMNDLLEPLRLIYQRAATQKGIKLRIAPSKATLVTDRVLLIRILSNLVSNAIKYTTQGGIVIGCRSQADTIKLQVWDTGSGLSEEQLNALLDSPDHAQRFTNSEPGLGGGMQIANLLADKLGARLLASSVPGNGSLFECVLDKPPTRSLSSYHCYVLDSDPLTKKWFQQAGIEADHNLPQSSNQPLLIDYDYGGVANGLNVAREKIGDFPALIVMSYDRAADIRSSTAEVAQYLAYKPLTPEAIYTLLYYIKKKLSESNSVLPAMKGPRGSL